MPTIYKGVVTSIGKMNKTCTVTVTYFREARKILRPVRRTTKFLVHDEDHLSRIGDSVTITDGISYTNRKQFRLHTIDRSGQDPRAFAKKAPEWVRMENKAKALVDRATKAQETRQANADRREKERESYTRRMLAAGIGAGKGVIDGLGGAIGGKARTTVPGLGASKGAKQPPAR